MPLTAVNGENPRGSKPLTADRGGLLPYPEILHQCAILVLCREAGVEQVAIHPPPLPQPAIVKRLQAVGDDEGDNGVVEALLEEDQSANTPVAVLEGVDGLEAVMEVDE